MRKTAKPTQPPSAMSEELRKSASAGNSSSLFDDGTGVSRYEHDLQQARQMQRSRSAQSSSRPDTSPQNNDTVEEDTITLGLRGLDEAECLRDHGDIQNALKIYELSIELLIRYLRESSPKKKKGSLPRVNRDVVAERVRVALSDAEHLKESAAASVASSQQQSPSTSLQPAATSPTMWHSLSSALSSALSQIPPTKASPVSSEPPVYSSTTTQSKVSNDATATRRSSRRTTKPPSASTTAKEKTSTTTATTQRKTRRKPTLDYNKNDPLVQIVKDDLYVDPTELQNTTWDDIAGLETAKRSLQEAAIMPLLRPDLFTGLRKAQNILLYGPPGTGKTMLVRAVAHESSCLLFACTASALTSKWHGEGEKLVRTLFRLAHDVAPSIIFVDEMDALLSSRTGTEHEASRRFKTEFMINLDGIVKGSDANAQDVQHGVLIIGCTNCPWDIDDAVLRRFPRRIHVPLPDAEARRGLITKLLQKADKHNLTKRDVTKLVKQTEGYSCSDIVSIASDAAFGPLRSLGDMDAIRDVRTQDVRPISIRDFEHAIQSSLRSVTPALLERYTQWEQQQAS